MTLPLSRPADGPPGERIVLTLADGYRTNMYCYRPAGGVQERGAIVYLHGIQSHPGWFVGSARFLSSQGYAVYQVTRRGSGENAVNRGHAAGDRQLLDDLDTACRMVSQRHPRSPLHLLGVSWGGKLAACYCLWPRRKTGPATLTLVAPGIVPLVDVPWTTKVKIAMSLLSGGRRLFDIPLNEVELFTANPQMQEYLLADQLRLHEATARFLYASRQLDRMLASSGDGSITAATSLILAQRDRIIDNGATAGVVRRLAGERAIITALDAAHTIEFESDPLPLYQLLLESLQPAS